MEHTVFTTHGGLVRLADDPYVTLVGEDGDAADAADGDGLVKATFRTGTPTADAATGLSMETFRNDLFTLLNSYGLLAPPGEDATPAVHEERVTAILLAEVHDWFRAGRVDPALYEEDFVPEDATWTEFARAMARANLEADKADPTYPGGDPGDEWDRDGEDGGGGDAA